MIDVLWEASWRGVLVALAVGMVLAVLRVRNAAARHGAWTAVMLVMLALPAWVAWGPVWRVAVEVPAAPQVEDVRLPELPVADVPPAPHHDAPLPAPAPRRNWTAIIYLAGLGLMGTRVLYGTWRGARITRAVCAVPVTVGLWRPRVVVPQDFEAWPAQRQRAVLDHEQAHARRRDPLVLWLAAWNRCVFWFHPLAWWLERKLAGLAEEACDEVALSRGAEAAAYAELLVEMAGRVRRAGGRVAAVGYTDGGLRPRVERLLRGRVSGHLSRARAVCAAGLCALAVFAGGGCALERIETQRAAAGQPSMNERMHQQAAKRAAQKAARDEKEKRAAALSAADVAALEAKLKVAPGDASAREQLALHYRLKNDIAGVRRHVLWWLEHDPLNKSRWLFRPWEDRAGWEAGRKFMLAHVARPGAGPEIYLATGHFLRAWDGEAAERVLAAGWKRFPESNLGRHLGELYYSMLPNSDRVRKLAAETRDAGVLTGLASGAMMDSKRFMDAGVADRGLAFAQRALELAPELQAPRMIAAHLKNFRQASQREGPWRRLEREWAQFSHGREGGDKVKSTAEQLLREAESAGEDKSTMLYDAHMILGKLALRSDDRRTARKHLLAAAAVTPNEELKFRQRLMFELPIAIIDWGERDAAAEYFERVGAWNYRGEDLRRWAAEIRKGINPEILGYATGCSKDPC